MLRRKLESKVVEQRKRIAELELQLGKEKAYLEGLEDSLKLFPAEGMSVAAPTLREGSELAKARDALRKEGKPLHVDELPERAVALERGAHEPADEILERAVRGELAGAHMAAELEVGIVAPSWDTEAETRLVDPLSEALAHEEPVPDERTKDLVTQGPVEDEGGRDHHGVHGRRHVQARHVLGSE